MMVRTKIIATLGPASSTPAIIRKMTRAGLDVVRLNFSHGTLEEHGQRISLVRRLNAKYRRHVRILGDLEGHRIRIGDLPRHAAIVLKKGQIFWLLQRGAAAKDAAPFDYEGGLQVIRPGQAIYVDDGNIHLKTLSVSGSAVKTEVIVAGLLKEHKGVNIPGAALRFGGLPEKDRRDIAFAAAMELDYLAQSFVRSARDVRRVRERVQPRWPGCRIIAKIENREGVRRIDEIIAASDGIMIARGDMGVSLPIYEVPIIQKEIIAKCNAQKKFVITATQMLENMVSHRLPTRAEATDVANAVLDGTDFVMLSEETAAGRYPAEAVDMMNKIIKFAEAARTRWKRRGGLCPES